MKENPLYLNPEDWAEFLEIISKYDSNFYAYGSRVKGTHTKFSDIDLCMVGDSDILQIKEDFYNSNLPIKVDIKHINDFSQSFLDLIKKDFILIN